MKKISIGKQDFAALREKDCFYIDKTKFINEWWDSEDDITLIARPRRFGKTLNMSMLNCFFSNRYANRGDLFKGLSIWNNEKFRNLQGTYPVIFISFADVKQTNYNDSIQKIKRIITTLYQENIELASSDVLTNEEKKQFLSVNLGMTNEQTQSALKNLSCYMYRYYGKKTVILLDEYDTPLQEAYLNGYWKEFTDFIRSLLNSTFKTNPYLEKAVMTGITRISKESIFSDLNNLNVVTVTSNEYAECFGFIEEEVFEALDNHGLSNEKEQVKQWYNGFIFGKHKDIYNPWSITNYLNKKEIHPYWANTSSNALVSNLIQKSSADFKSLTETLMQNKQICVNFDEQIIFCQLEEDENSIWSLLVASGYLKVNKVEYRGELKEAWYYLSITNLETKSMFNSLFSGWFKSSAASYGSFIKYLMQGDLEAINYYMNKITLATFSYFDIANEPERFYHGFVLGLMAERAEFYELRSNRESGFGRYDIMMIPKNIQNEKTPAIIIEFKVRSTKKESSLEETVKSALLQIKEKNYDAELIALGINSEKIRHYGFAFEGKKVLIGE